MTMNQWIWGTYPLWYLILYICIRIYTYFHKHIGYIGFDWTSLGREKPSHFCHIFLRSSSRTSKRRSEKSSRTSALTNGPIWTTFSSASIRPAMGPLAALAMLADVKFISDEILEIVLCMLQYMNK